MRYMKISLKNVAIVEKAEIEINGITVVAGLNGSGKTTAAKAIYASVNAYTDLSKRIKDSRQRSMYNSVVHVLNKHTEIRSQVDYYSMVYNLSNNFPFQNFVGKEITECGQEIRKYIAQWANETNSEIGNESIVEEIYQSILNSVIRTDEEYIKFLVESKYLNVFSHQINCLKNDQITEIETKLDDLELVANFEDNELTGCVQSVECAKKAIYIESFNVLDMFKNYRMFIRPVRNGTIASKELLSYLIPSDENEEQSFEEYENNKELKRIIDIIISKVTHGKLNVDANGNMDFFDNTTNQPINIANLSAGIKVFVILQSLLENGQLKKEDILLIDEPEVNLHPEWQVVFAEILVLLQKEIGLNIYVNTHSPYFARAIEVKLAEYGIADKGRFYLFRQQENNLCVSEDVTDCTEKIYFMLYKPLESL